MLLSSVCCVDCKRSTCEQAERRSGGDATRGYLERTHLLPLLPQQLLQLAHALTLLLELGAEARLGAIGHRGGLAHARGCGAAAAERGRRARGRRPHDPTPPCETVAPVHARSAWPPRRTRRDTQRAPGRVAAKLACCRMATTPAAAPCVTAPVNALVHRPSTLHMFRCEKACTPCAHACVFASRVQCSAHNGVPPGVDGCTRALKGGSVQHASQHVRRLSARPKRQAYLQVWRLVWLRKRYYDVGLRWVPWQLYLFG